MATSLDQPGAPNSNTGHGHVYKRPDGQVARCGGPSICRQCALDAATKNQEQPPPAQVPHIESLLNQGHALVVKRDNISSGYHATCGIHNAIGPTPAAAISNLDAYLWRKVFSPVAAKEREAGQSSGGTVGSAPSSYSGPDSASKKAAAPQPVARDKKKS